MSNSEYGNVEGERPSLMESGVSVPTHGARGPGPTRVLASLEDQLARNNKRLPFARVALGTTVAVAGCLAAWVYWSDDQGTPPNDPPALAELQSSTVPSVVANAAQQATDTPNADVAEVKPPETLETPEPAKIVNESPAKPTGNRVGNRVGNQAGNRVGNATRNADSKEILATLTPRAARKAARKAALKLAHGSAANRTPSSPSDKKTGSRKVVIAQTIPTPQKPQKLFKPNPQPQRQQQARSRPIDQTPAKNRSKSNPGSQPEVASFRKSMEADSQLLAAVLRYNSAPSATASNKRIK